MAPGVKDLTRILHPGHPVWPGDAPFELNPTATFPKDGVLVHEARLSLHTGTHLEGPGHVLRGGAGILDFPPELMLAEGILLDLKAPLPQTLPALVFLKTGEPDTWRAFPEVYRPLPPKLARALVDLGAKLVGTDAPSVDPIDSRDLEVHHLLARAGVWVLEGLALASVGPGRYRFGVFPLRLAAEAAPARVLAWET